MTLGDLITMLSAMPSDAKVRFNFCWAEPTGEVSSYRGYYDQLALHWRDGGRGGDYNAEDVTVASLLKRLKAAVGEEFTGWKGGEYVMDENTRVWVDNSGDAAGTAVAGVTLRYGTVIILTEQGD